LRLLINDELGSKKRRRREEGEWGVRE